MALISSPASTTTLCPYCGRMLQWMPARWMGRGVFQCVQCGDFPDFRASHSDSARPGNAPRWRVLIVDDDEGHRELYAAMIGDTMTAVAVAGGREAIATAKAQPPDLILLDVMMPVMDGFQVCERLKSEPDTASIPIVMLTSLDAADVPARAHRAGAAAVLMKPCPVERLMLTIESAVQKV